MRHQPDLKTTRRSRLLRYRSARVGLALLSVLIFAAPFAVSFRPAAEARHVGPQHKYDRDGRLSEDELQSFARLRTQPSLPSAPTIVFYRDIRPIPQDTPAVPGVVSPNTFEEHMEMLAAAGFTTLTSDQLLGWLDGRPVPPHSVVLTFDGGTRGAWVYADPLLRRHRLHGVLLIPTGVIGERDAQRLNWTELRRMQRLGHWDLESQGHSGGRTVPISWQGQSGGFFAYRSWLPDQRRRESFQELQRRVEADLRTARATAEQHGLPAPRLFGYPSGDHLPAHGRAIAHPAALPVVAAQFRAQIMDADSPSPVSRRAQAKGRLTRLQVESTTTASQLFRRLEGMAAVKVTSAAPLTSERRWAIDWQDAGKLEFSGDSMTFDSKLPGRLDARYGPQATEDWPGFRVEVTVDGLVPGDTGTTAGLMVLESTPAACDLRVSGAAATFVCPQRGVIQEKQLEPADSRQLEVVVRQGEVDYRIDGVDAFDVDPPEGGPATGGFGVSISRPNGSDPAPGFRDMRLRPVD
jgi:biofilm PGA synthesis lipoprotein PgaB